MFLNVFVFFLHSEPLTTFGNLQSALSTYVQFWGGSLQGDPGGGGGLNRSLGPEGAALPKGPPGGDFTAQHMHLPSPGMSRQLGLWQRLWAG